MDLYRTSNVEAAVKDTAAYGGQLAAVFHQYALIAPRIPVGFEGAINILDATVSTLNQVLSLFKDEAEGFKNGTGKELFSIEGIQYVQLLVTECAKTLAKVEPVVNDACLPRKEFNAKVKRDKKELAKKGIPEVKISSLKLDEEAFLDKVESVNWRLAEPLMEKCMERLYDLQLHLLLVYQVVTVGALSQDLSTGKVDVKSIVTYHSRIVRTADLLGIEVPKGQKARSKKIRDDSSSDSDSLDLSSESDSDVTCISSIKSEKRPFKMVGPPPPPPRPIIDIEPQERAPPMMPTPPRSDTSSSIPPPPRAQGFPWDAKPPSYSESHKTVVNGAPASANGSTLLGTVSQASTSPNSTSSVADEKSKPSPTSFYPDEKNPAKAEVAKETQTQIIKPTVLEPHLFRSRSNTFKFRFKSLFASKEALAAEMRKALCGADSHLLAFVVQRHDMRQVPHSAFHSLEATHMKTILSQLNDNSWYQNFTNLNQVEHSTLQRVLYPWADGKVHEREMVVLQVLKEGSKLNAWVALLKELLNKNPFPLISNERILLAIVREKLVDGKPIIAPHRINAPPPPPPCLVAPVMPAIRPPPLPNNARRTAISDLRLPPPPMPTNFPPPPRGPPGPPPPGQRPPPPPGQRLIGEATPVTDHDAMLCLTTYNEYTLRPTESLDLHAPRSWARVAITQESAERHLVLQRVQQYQRSGGNVLETKLRFTEDQSGQVDRLMDNLKFGERDVRFEWCWVEVSLRNAAGEITEFVPNIAATATLIHLIAKRMPKPHLKPLDLYNSLMRGPPTPRPGPPGPPGPAFRPQPPPPGRPGVIDPRRVSDTSDSDSDSDSDSSWSGSGSDRSVGYVRRKMRKIRAKKISRVTRRGKGKRFYNDSDSDFDSDSDSEEDVIKVKVETKRGDDIVKKLLDMWTPGGDVKGKGKATE